MCKEYPGPRCSNHGGKVLKKAEEEFAVAQKLDPSSLEYRKAELNLVEAKEQYASTPDGIEQASKRLAAHPNDAELKKAYESSVRQRNQQIEALNEIQNTRLNKIAQVVTPTQQFYDVSEMESILASVRRNNERLGLAKELDNVSSEEAKSQYAAILNRLEGQLTEKRNLTTEEQEAFQSLRAMDAPTSVVTLKTYADITKALPRSQSALKAELSTIAQIQNAPLNVVQSYYDGYRQQYKEQFANLPKAERPDPPKEWVSGDYAQSGFQRNKASVFAPSDNASMYALYRMRVDENAIPDYMKTSKMFASVSLEGDTPTNPEKASLIFYTPKGKELSRFVTQESSGRSLRSYIPEIAEQLNGKTLITQQATPQSSWFKEQLQQYGHNSSPLTTSEMASKHLNIPSDNLASICQETGVQYKTGTPVDLSETTMKAFVMMRKKAKMQWASKTARKNAPTINEIPLTSRWT